MSDKVANSPGGIEGEAGLAPARDSATVTLKLAFSRRGKKYHVVNVFANSSINYALCGVKDLATVANPIEERVITCSRCKAAYRDFLDLGEIIRGRYRGGKA